MTSVDEDDEIIFRLRYGATLQAKKDMHMQDGLREQVFTAGRKYQVISMHPLAATAYVVVANDHGETHKFWAEHIREYFVVGEVR